MRWVVALFGLLIVASLGIWGLEFAMVEAGTDVDVINESWTPQNNTWVEVNSSDEPRSIFEKDTTVYNETNTTMLIPEDYRWSPENQSLWTNTTGNLSQDDNATVTYGYSQLSEDAWQFSALLSYIPLFIGIVFIGVIDLIFLGLLRG